MDNNKTKLVQQSTKELEAGFRQLFEQQFSRMYDDCERIYQQKMQIVEERNGLLQQQINNLEKEKDSLGLTIQNLRSDITTLKNQGSIIDFIEAWLLPFSQQILLWIHQNEAQYGGDYIAPIKDILTEFLKKKFSKYQIELLFSENGKSSKVDFTTQQVVSTVSTNNPAYDGVVYQTLVPGVKAPRYMRHEQIIAWKYEPASDDRRTDTLYSQATEYFGYYTDTDPGSFVPVVKIGQAYEGEHSGPIRGKIHFVRFLVNDKQVVQQSDDLLVVDPQAELKDDYYGNPDGTIKVRMTIQKNGLKIVVFAGTRCLKAETINI